MAIFSCSVEQMLYSRFIKYSALKRIIDKEFNGSNATEINIYIDLYSLFTMLYNCDGFMSPYSICSASINYCAHFRDFFRSRYGVDSNIILVYSTNTCETNRRFLPEYNSKYQNRIIHNNRIENVVKVNMTLLSIIAPYLPKIYLKTGGADSAVIIKNLIDSNILPDNPNLVVSKSTSMFMLPVNARNAVVVRKRNYDGEDCSFSYNRNDCLDWFVSETKNLNISQNHFRQNLITMIMLLIGAPDLGIKALCHVSKALDISDHIPAGYELDIEKIYGEYSKACKNHLSPQAFAARFNALDLVTQTALYKTLPESDLNQFKIDSYDPDEVRRVNDKYFKSCPIDLERL